MQRIPVLLIALGWASIAARTPFRSITAFIALGLIMALAWAAEGKSPDRPVHVGITATASGFYGAQGREVPGFPPVRSDVVDGLARQGVLNLEMEISALLTLASLRGFRAGAICAVYATRYDGQFISDRDRDSAETACVGTGLEALHKAAEIESGRGDRAIWHPGISE